MFSILMAIAAIAALIFVMGGLQLVSSYIPPRDADLDTWCTHFSSLITAAPATYGLVAADATAIAGVVATWHAAYLAATNGSTRGPMTVQAKNSAKASMLPTIRSYSQQIANNAGVATDDKIALGINPRTSTPTPIPPPSSSPILAVVGATPLQLTVRMSDQNTPDSRAKPFGATSAQIFAKSSGTPVSDPEALVFVGNFTTNPIALDLEVGDIGKQVYIAARWVTRRGDVGPWSNIINFTGANGA